MKIIGHITVALIVTVLSTIFNGWAFSLLWEVSCADQILQNEVGRQDYRPLRNAGGFDRENSTRVSAAEAASVKRD